MSINSELTMEIKMNDLLSIHLSEIALKLDELVDYIEAIS